MKKLILAKKFMKINPIIKKLLQNRGVYSEEEIMEFLSDKPQKTYDPFLLPDMEAGVDLILSETKKNSRIWVYGDYYADGITSTTLMMSILKKLTSADNLNYYIPSRFEEGYGLNKTAVEGIAKQGYTLMITVDCGISAIEEVKYANELGIETIVTDHHEPGNELPEAIAVVDAKRKDSKYPCRDLAGVGVVFKLIQAIGQKLDLDEKEYLKSYYRIEDNVLDEWPVFFDNTSLKPTSCIQPSFCDPRTAATACEEYIGFLKNESDIVILPADEYQNDDYVIDLINYQGDILYSNFKHKSNHTAYLWPNEINYYLGKAATDTYSMFYCDFSHELIQLGMCKKLQRWVLNHKLMLYYHHEKNYFVDPRSADDITADRFLQ